MIPRADSTASLGGGMGSGGLGGSGVLLGGGGGSFLYAPSMPGSLHTLGTPGTARVPSFVAQRPYPGERVCVHTRVCVRDAMWRGGVRHSPLARARAALIAPLSLPSSSPPCPPHSRGHVPGGAPFAAAAVGG